MGTDIKRRSHSPKWVNILAGVIAAVACVVLIISVICWRNGAAVKAEAEEYVSMMARNPDLFYMYSDTDCTIMSVDMVSGNMEELCKPSRLFLTVIEDIYCNLDSGEIGFVCSRFGGKSYGIYFDSYQSKGIWGSWREYAEKSATPKAADAEYAVGDGSVTLTTNEELNSFISTGNKDEFKELTIEGEIREIPQEAFSGCENLQKLILGDQVTTIGNSAFYGCSSLSDIQWSAGLESIGENAFAKTAICQLVLPNKVSFIGYGAFDDCALLGSVSLPDSIVTIEGGFQNCITLKEVKLPGKLIRIDDYMFAGCTALQEIVIPEGTETIGYDAFTETGLRRIVFGSAVNTIESLRTSLCPELMQLVFLGDIPENAIGNADGNSDDTNLGLVYRDGITIYYLKQYSNSWSPNGETEWNGFPIVGIDSMDDLPDID